VFKARAGRPENRGSILDERTDFFYTDSVAHSADLTGKVFSVLN
jgi:hypothetical protein